jgi:cytochrome c biogenesis protein CcdA
MEPKPYAEVWGDTVDLRHLSIAIVIGIAVSLTFYLVGLKFILRSLPKTPQSLTQAYALLIGILGCLVSAVVSTKLFPPKRTLRENQFNAQEREAALSELQIDWEKEREELKTLSPQIVAEMKELQIYEIFAEPKPKTTGKAGS